MLLRWPVEALAVYFVIFQDYDPINGYTWSNGNTYPDETSARGEALFWRDNAGTSVARDTPGYVRAAGYWAWNPGAQRYDLHLV